MNFKSVFNKHLIITLFYTMLVAQCITFIIGGSPIIMTGLYFILCNFLFGIILIINYK